MSLGRDKHVHDDAIVWLDETVSHNQIYLRVPVCANGIYLPDPRSRLSPKATVTHVASSTGPCRLPSWRTASPNRNGLVADGGHARLARGGGQRISTPSGIVDIAPTILHLIGLAQPKLPADAGAGRVLGETLKNTQGESTSEAIRHSVGTKNFEQELLADRFDGKIYLRSARRLV